MTSKGLNKRPLPVSALSTALARSKLRPPSCSERYVRRERLVNLLNEVVAAPVTTVVAPAGAGKTTLVAGWVSESAIQTAWFTIDESDRDLAALWTGVITALEGLQPNCGSTSFSLLRQNAPFDAVLSALLEDLDVEHEPAVVVLDDVHLLDNEPNLKASVCRFALNTPGWLHVVLVSRHEPGLPVDRLRARAQLAEVHFAELRFSHDEARDLLQRLSDGLDEGEIDRTIARADGWAASLQLSALAARSVRAHPPEDHDDLDDATFIRDFVVHEAFAGEDPALVGFLRDISVVDRVNWHLAAELSRRANAADLLSTAHARGLFITPLTPLGWFEIHSLVRQVLMIELADRDPARFRQMHGRAARWLEASGDIAVALDHWALADRPRETLRLLAARHAELYDSGREAAIHRALATIPWTVATEDLDAMIDFAWCHLLVSRRDFTNLVAHVAWSSERKELDEATSGRVTMLRSVAATVNGRSAEGGMLAREAMDMLGVDCQRDRLGRFGWNAVAREAALAEQWDEGNDRVRNAALALGGDPERRLAFEGTSAIAHSLAGRPLDALRIAAGVRHAAAVTNMTILRAELSLAEAIAHREIGDRPLAAAELSALATTPAETMIYCEILAAAELAQLRLDDGEIDDARRILERAEERMREEGFGIDGINWLSRVGTMVALASGRVEEAHAWAAAITDSFWAGISHVRIDIAEQSWSCALDKLADLTPRCPRHEVLMALLRARALSDPEESLKFARVALEHATLFGMLQTVASEGPEVVELIERVPWQAPPNWMDRLRRAALPNTRALSGSAEWATLTDRERDVMRFLSSRLTLREIASELYVSLNTLKFHLKVIYRKLGVNSRAEAAEVARQMSIRRDA